MINRNADIKRPPSRQDTKESPSRRQGHLAGSERNRLGPLKPEKKNLPPLSASRPIGWNRLRMAAIVSGTAGTREEKAAVNQSRVDFPSFVSAMFQSTRADSIQRHQFVYGRVISAPAAGISIAAGLSVHRSCHQLVIVSTSSGGNVTWRHPVAIVATFHDSKWPLIAPGIR